MLGCWGSADFRPRPPWEKRGPIHSPELTWLGTSLNPTPFIPSYPHPESVTYRFSMKRG